MYCRLSLSLSLPCLVMTLRSFLRAVTDHSTPLDSTQWYGLNTVQACHWSRPLASVNIGTRPTVRSRSELGMLISQQETGTIPNTACIAKPDVEDDAGAVDAWQPEIRRAFVEAQLRQTEKSIYAGTARPNRQPSKQAEVLESRNSLH